MERVLNKKLDLFHFVLVVLGLLYKAHENTRWNGLTLNEEPKPSCRLPLAELPVS